MRRLWMFRVIIGRFTNDLHTDKVLRLFGISGCHFQQAKRRLLDSIAEVRLEALSEDLSKGMSLKEFISRFQREKPRREDNLMDPVSFVAQMQIMDKLKAYSERAKAYELAEEPLRAIFEIDYTPSMKLDRIDTRRKHVIESSIQQTYALKGIRRLKENMRLIHESLSSV